MLFFEGALGTFIPVIPKTDSSATEDDAVNAMGDNSFSFSSLVFESNFFMRGFARGRTDFPASVSLCVFCSFKRLPCCARAEAVFSRGDFLGNTELWLAASPSAELPASV